MHSSFPRLLLGQIVTTQAIILYGNWQWQQHRDGLDAFKLYHLFGHFPSNLAKSASSVCVHCNSLVRVCVNVSHVIFVFDKQTKREKLKS